MDGATVEAGRRLPRRARPLGWRGRDLANHNGDGLLHVRPDVRALLLLSPPLGPLGGGPLPLSGFRGHSRCFLTPGERGTGGDAGYAVEPEQAQGTSSNAKASAKGEAVELRAAPADSGVALE